MLGSKGKRAFAWALAILMIGMVIVPSISMMAHAEDDYEYEEDYDEEEAAANAAAKAAEAKDQLAELNDKFKELQEQQNQINAKLNQAKSEKDKQIAARQQIDNQINTTIATIDTLNERIAVLGENINEKEREMKAKQKEYDATYELFKKRMRAMYISGGSSNTIGLVLGADSYSQFLMRAEVVTRVAEHDRNLMEELDNQKKELEQIKQGIEDDKKGVEGDKTEVQAKQGELNVQKQEANARIQDIAAMEKEFLANKAQKQAEMKKVQAEMDKIYAEINKTSVNVPYSGGTMLWPAPNLGQVTCPYGLRFGGSDFHTGIDISGGGAYGATIRASNSGVVKVANTSFSQGVGYGKYVIIDHGGGIQTLYAHCSALNVSVGQSVQKGDKIAEVGSTGWSTGPHVHFEVRRNGKSENPVGWLNG